MRKTSGESFKNNGLHHFNLRSFAEFAPLKPFIGAVWGLSCGDVFLHFSCSHGTTYSIIQVMNTAAKLLESMRANHKDWRIEQLQTIARQHDVTWRQRGTSHCVFV
jgi:hypothetical protein